MTVLVPTSLDGALRALAEHPEAHVLAGGTDLMVEVTFGHRRPGTVVALRRVDELRGWTFDAAAGVVTVGAGVTYTELLEPDVADLLPALAQAARTVGSPQIRNAGTVGGNLGTCSPAGDLLPVLSALDASIHLASATARRTVPIHEFMLGVKRTALVPGELVVAASVPVPGGFQGYAKVGVRNAMVISVAGACLVVRPAERAITIALGAVGPTIVRASGAEAWVAGQVHWEAGTLAHPGVPSEFGERVAAESRPIDDHRSTAAYRRHAVSVLAARLLRRAFP